MNQTPNPNKKPTAPPPAPKWNPYYRRNPDGTPGGHDQTLQQAAERNDTAARQARERQDAARASAHRAAQASAANSEGLGQPVRRAGQAGASSPRVRSAGQSEPVPQRKPGQPAARSTSDKQSAPGGTRYRRNGDGTISRVYPHSTSRAGARRNKKLLTVAAAAVVLIALVIGIVSLIGGLQPDVVYTYDYGGQYEVEVGGEDARPDDEPYLNMNYLAALYSMAVSGSYDDMKFSTTAGEYISFVPDSRVTMVNGNRHVMSAPALLRGQEMWIPSDFAESMFVGLAVKWDDEKYTVTVTPKPISETDKTAAPLTFKLRPAGSAGTVSGEAFAEGYQYLTDMTAYQQAIEPADRDAYLILVNKEESLTATYVPAGLVDVTNMKAGYENRQKMNEVAERALQALYQDMQAAGFTDVGVTSGYRTYQIQEMLFERYVKEEMEKGLSRAEAEKAANRYSARAGQSEHQTGLAVDMYDTGSATVEFADSPAFDWLRENAHQYGFILRYPEDKTKLTGYDFEPWHYRYVGRYHATQMHESGLCLEEYLAKLP